jgi:hypothetical protein
VLVYKIFTLKSINLWYTKLMGATLGKPVNWKQTFADTTSTVNLTPTTGDDASILVKRLFNDAGYTTQMTSNGSSFSTNSDIIGTSSSALAHNNAYFDLKSPDGKRTLLFRRGATSRSLEFAVSIVGFNSDGTASTPPTASDKQYLQGDGTAGGFNNFWPADNTYWFSGAYQNASPYGVYAFTIFITPSANQSVQVEATLMVDPLAFLFHPSDPDPCMYYFCQSGNGNCGFRRVSQASGGGLLNDDVAGVAGGLRGWIGKGATGGGWAAIPAAARAINGASQVIPHNVGASLFDNNDTPWTVEYTRTSVGVTAAGTPYGGKGISSVLRYPLQQGFIGDFRNYTSGAKDGIILNDCILPWPSGLKLNRP